MKSDLKITLNQLRATTCTYIDNFNVGHLKFNQTESVKFPASVKVK